MRRDADAPVRSGRETIASEPAPTGRFSAMPPPATRRRDAAPTAARSSARGCHRPARCTDRKRPAEGAHAFADTEQAEPAVPPARRLRQRRGSNPRPRLPLRGRCCAANAVSARGAGTPAWRATLRSSSRAAPNNIIRSSGAMATGAPVQTDVARQAIALGDAVGEPLQRYFEFQVVDAGRTELSHQRPCMQR